MSVLLSGIWFASRGLPQRIGSATIPGLSAAVEVRFDAYGVPHVEASNAPDLFRAVGWLHANDRMFQLELGRRSVQGRLAELFGAPALEHDREARELRLVEASKACFERLGTESRGALEAYAEGVNAWLEQRGADLPPEFKLLGARPAAWTALDGLGFHVLLGKDLCATFLEQRRWNWIVALGEQRAADLMGAPALELGPELAQLAEQSRKRRPARPGTEGQELQPGGSNAWAIGAQLCAGRGPLVASDPHLRTTLPSIWYQARLVSPEYSASGMLLPGLPLVVIGQGPRVAWAFTNVEADLYDVWIERTRDGGRQVERAGAWFDVAVDEEAIPVRGGEPTPIVLRRTPQGPLVAFGGDEFATLDWGLYAAFDPLAPLFALARAESVDELEDLLESFQFPVQNVIAADIRGGLRQTVMGWLPDRDGADGRVPRAGWLSAWNAPTLLERRLTRPPRRAQGEAEFLASANDDARGTAQPAGTQADFALPHRRQRIEAGLRAGAEWNAASCAELQADLRDEWALEVVKLLPKLPSAEPARRAKKTLLAWDGRMDTRGPSALFALFLRELQIGVFSDEFWPHGLPMPAYPEREGLLLRLLGGETKLDWFDDQRTPRHETREEVIEEALARAWSEGERRFGLDIQRWEYGKLHRWSLAHPMATLPWLGRFVRRGPFAVGGSATSIQVHAGPMRWISPVVEALHGASMRWVADVADPDDSLALLPSGQSGHPFDSHFDDQIDDYLANRAHAAAWSPDAIVRSAERKLVLRPASKR